MKVNKIKPKDKSNYMYYSNVGRNLKCTKPLLVITEFGYKIGVYVHTRKEWLDSESFEITSLGWVDLEEALNSAKKNKKQ